MKYLKLYECELHEIEQMESAIREAVDEASKKNEKLEVHDYKVSLGGASAGGAIEWDGGSQYADLHVIVGVIYSK